jgi:hypothetical protein
MGQYTTVPTGGQDLARNVVHFPEVKPSAVLFNLLGMMMTAAQRLTSTLDSQVGENPGQNQKATTTMAVQEEGKRIFSGIYKRNHRALKKELKRLYYLNSIHLPPSSYLNVLDGLKEEEKEQIGEEIFNRDFDLASVNIVPAADSNYTSEQLRLARARSLQEKIGTGLVNPQVAMRRVLEAEEQPAIEEIMEMPEPQPPFEVTKFQQEMQYKWADLQLRTMDKEEEWERAEILAHTQAILNLAKAEGEEAGTQLADHKAQLDVLIQTAKERDSQRKLAQEQMQQATEQPA